MVTGEEWRSVVGYEGLYEVSNLGNVRSLDRIACYAGGKLVYTRGKNLCNIRNQSGYIRVNLCKDGWRKAKFVHRLVAEAFIENPNGYSQINHRDENTANNTVDNLEWCDSRYNCNYGNHAKRVSQSMKGKNAKRVISVNESTGEATVYSSLTEAAARIGKCKSYVRYAAQHPQKQYCGYLWRYADG